MTSDTRTPPAMGITGYPMNGCRIEVAHGRGEALEISSLPAHNRRNITNGYAV